MKLAKFGVLIGFFIYFLLTSNVYALTTETIYATNSNCTFSDSGKYKNISSNGTISTNSINTTYNGKSYGMTFYFAEDMLTTKVYQLKITFMADDLLPRVNENFISIITFDTSCEQDYATILSIEKNTNNGNATILTINYIPSMTSNKANILIGSPSSPTQITGETTFGIKSVQIGDRESQGNEQIIINNNQNTQNIINNENQNTQNIIDNQNQNTDKQIESQKVCHNDTIDTANNSGYLNSSGNVVSDNNWKYTDYIRADKITMYSKFSTDPSICYYDKDKTLISCNNYGSISNGELTLPNNTKYFRASIYINSNLPNYNKTPYFKIEYCENGNQAISDSVNDLNNSINDSDIDNSEYADFFNGFTTNTFGLTSIITAPLNLIESLTSSTCSNLELPLPYLNNKKISLPCMSSIYSTYFGSFFTIYQTITFGIVAYWVIVRIFNQVKDFKNPDHDEIEVVDL